MAENDVVFQEAVEALREGKKARARELLTGLLKTDQNNATYWVWMSAAVDSTRERIYCLQTALKLDPENATAKRGLILHGALPPDQSVQPFPANRPRAWEEKLLLAHEKPRLKGWAAVRSSPVARIGGFAVLGAVIVSAVVFGFIIPRIGQQSTAPTNTPGPSPTWTLTPTSINATGQPVLLSTSAPLSELLPAPYTATPLYAVTPRSPLTSDMYRSVKLAYEKGDWDAVIRGMQEILKSEPEAADVYYYMGEAYRFKAEYPNAIMAYQSSLRVNPNFGPGYVGLARARLGLDPNTDVTSFLDEAIRLDPNFGEAYLERAQARLRQNNISGALNDLAKADPLFKNSSPLVYFTLAQARYQEGDLEQALAAAQRANQLDVTSLPTYLLLGQIYAEMGEHEEAVKALDLYIKYRAEDSIAYLLLGKMEFENQDYEDAVDAMNKVLALNRNEREAYLYRFLANVELGHGDQADEDLDKILLYYSDNFDANIAVLRTHLLEGRNGSALLQVTKAEALAKTDEQKAQVYFWAAIVYETRKDWVKAAEYWQKLLALPDDALPVGFRDQAEQHLADLQSELPTPKVTLTPSRTPTRTPRPTDTRVPTQTFTATATPRPTRTPTPTP